MKSERDLFKATLIDMGYHESAFSFDSQTGMYALEMTQENWCIWQASASREGYKLVPVEINEDIESAMLSSVARGEMPYDIYKAMIGASE